MLAGFAKSIFGSSNDRYVRSMGKIVDTSRSSTVEVREAHHHRDLAEPFETPDDRTLIWTAEKPTFAPDMPPQGGAGARS